MRVGFITNQFQTDPLQADPVQRHPFAFGIETAVNDRFAVEGMLSDGIALGMKVGLLDESEAPVDFGLGFDQLLFPIENHLYGRDSIGLTRVTGRAWIGIAQTWEFVRARTALSVQPTVDGFEYAPHFALETAFHLPFSIGWETSWDADELRQTLGVSAHLKTLEIAGGLSEFQSWIFRDNSFGWFGSPPMGKLDGIGNPGWWLSFRWNLPPLRPEPPPPPPPVVNCPSPVVDVAAMKPVVDMLKKRLMQEDVAELAERTGYDITTNPLTMAVLRARILAGGPSSRDALWAIALDSATRSEDRLQAVVTLGAELQASDLEHLIALSEDAARSLRVEAAMGMGQLGGVAAEKKLQVLLRDPEESVRFAAQAAMEGMKAHLK